MGKDHCLWLPSPPDLDGTGETCGQHRSRQPDAAAVELFNNRNVVNDLLRRTGGFNVSRGWIFSNGSDVIKTMQEANLPFSVVAKPIHGRGSHAVKVCKYLDEFVDRARSVFPESPQIMFEGFLLPARRLLSPSCPRPRPAMQRTERSRLSLESTIRTALRPIMMS